MHQTITVGIAFHSATIASQFCEAIDSILNQTLLPSELHLIQDGPVQDELIEIVNDYIKSASFIKHIPLSQNLGLSHAINISILNTTSKYYARMDSDDISMPDRLQKQVFFLEENQDIDIVGGWAKEFETSSNLEGGFIRKVPCLRTDMEKVLHYRNPLIHPTVVFRRSVFAKIGLYDVMFRMEEDLELWTRAFKAQVGITNLPEILLYYRFTNSVTRRSAAVRYQIRARYKYNTYSLKLNLLKFMSISLRFLPGRVQIWAYKNLRSK